MKPVPLLDQNAEGARMGDEICRRQSCQNDIRSQFVLHKHSQFDTVAHEFTVELHVVGMTGFPTYSAGSPRERKPSMPDSRGDGINHVRDFRRNENAFYRHAAVAASSAAETNPDSNSVR